MKTQFLVTVDHPEDAAPSLKDLREAVRAAVPEGTTATLRHLPEPPPEKDDPAYAEALRNAHMAGQDIGRRIGPDRWNQASDYVNSVILAKPTDSE